MASTFHIKRNDTYPPAEATLKSNGTAVDLTGASVRFHMLGQDGTVVVDAAATIEVAASGEVSYAWQAADTDEAGIYKCEWEVTYSGGGIQTFPNPGYNTVIIGGDIA